MAKGSPFKSLTRRVTYKNGNHGIKVRSSTKSNKWKTSAGPRKK